MKKVRPTDYNPTVFTFNCPGCKHPHYINTEQKNPDGAIWAFNKDVINPTFTPSINYRTGKYSSRGSDCNCGVICHFIITDGNIEFQSDCTHGLRSQKIQLPIL